MADEAQQVAAPEGAVDPGQAAPEGAPAAQPTPEQQPDYWARVTELDGHARALAQENRSLREQIQRGGRAGPDVFKQWIAENPNDAVDLVLASLPEPEGGQGRHRDTPVQLPRDVQERLARLDQIEQGQRAVEERLAYSDFKTAVSANPDRYGIYKASPKRLDLAFRAYRQLGDDARGITIDQWLDAAHQAQMDELKSELGQVREAKLFPDLFGGPAAAPPNGRGTTAAPAPAIGGGSGDTPTQREMTDEEIIRYAARRAQGLE